MKRTTKKSAGKGQLAVVERNDHSALLAHFAQCPELFSPLLAVIESGKQSIAAVMNQAGRAMVELMLQLSAGTIAGQKRPGRQDGEVLWHGSQGGQVCLLERRLKVQKPRLRTRGGQARIQPSAITFRERTKREIALQQHGERLAPPNAFYVLDENCEQRNRQVCADWGQQQDENVVGLEIDGIANDGAD